MAQLVFSQSKAQVDATAELPEVFAAVDRLAPWLGYPYELGAVSNVPISTTEDPEQTGFPRVDLLPPRGALLWFVVHDTRFARDPKASSPRDGVSVREVGPFQSAHESASRWENVRVWSKTVRMGPAKSLQIFGFAGTSTLAPTSEWAKVLSTLNVAA